MKIAGSILAALLLLAIGYGLYMTQIANPRVEREIALYPDGERAQRVMLLTLPSGRRIPVNYWREDDRVYAAADGRWWKELAEGPSAVRLLLRGEELRGSARAVRDDPEYTKGIFSKLRPNAVEGFGTLVEIRLDGVEADGPAEEPGLAPVTR